MLNKNLIRLGFPLALLAGCAAGPDFKKPDAPQANGYQTTPAVASTPAADAPKFVAGQDIPYDWWTLFQSPKLNSLIKKALQASPTLEIAQAALRQAQENVIAQQGFFYPTVSASYTPSRNKLAGNMGGNSPGQQQNGDVIQSSPDAPAYFNFHTAQLSVGYVPDIFGLNRRMTESAEAQAEWQNMQLQATQITLVSNLAAAAFQEAGLRAQLAATQAIIQANQENLEILRAQFKLGFASKLDLANQELALAQAQQMLPPLTKQLEQTRDLLRALLGRAPNQELSETFELSDFQLPKQLPLSLPAKLVEQRPDVRAAEAQLHFASAQYGVAIANRLPQFMVTANIGGMANSPDWMFKSGGSFFSLTGNISQLIFDGGTLKAKSRAAQQALKQADAQYRSTVIVALQNVADTLHAIQNDATASQAAGNAQQASQNVLELTRQQYQLGYVSYQILLNAQQTDQQARLNLVQAQVNRLGDTAALYQALGGGWWNQPEEAAPKNAAPAKVAVTNSPPNKKSATP